jgi:hypothetical protein
MNSAIVAAEKALFEQEGVKVVDTDAFDGMMDRLFRSISEEEIAKAAYEFLE